MKEKRERREQPVRIDRLPIKDRNRVIASVAEKTVQKDHLADVFGNVEMAFEMMREKRPEVKGAGEQLLTALDDRFSQQEMYTRYIYPTDMKMHESVTFVTSVIADIPPELQEGGIQQAFEKWPHIIRIYRAGVDMCKVAVEDSRKSNRIYNYALASGNYPDEYLERYVVAYTRVVSRIDQLDTMRSKDITQPDSRRQYTAIIANLESTPFSDKGPYSHPMDLKWGGISLHELRELPKGSERNQAIMRFCANLPKGDIFWQKLTAAIFFTEAKIHDPKDLYEEIIADFHMFFASEFLQHVETDGDDFIAQSQKFLEPYTNVEIDKLARTVGHFIAPKSNDPTDMYITYPISRPLAQVLHPVSRNLLEFLSTRPEPRPQHPPQARLLDKTIADVLNAQADMQRGKFSSSEHPIQQPKQEDVVGKNAEVLRVFALLNFFRSTAIDETLCTFPKTHKLYQEGFRQLLVQKGPDEERIQVRMFTEKNAVFTAEIDDQAHLSNCSWLIADHANALSYIVDFAIIGLTLSSYQKAGLNYGQLAVLKAYGFEMIDVGEQVNREKAIQQIYELEGEDPKTVLKRRGLKKLLQELFPEEALPPVHPGQEAIFELMQKAKQKGETK